jgi:hypothetical protein
VTLHRVTRLRFTGAVVLLGMCVAVGVGCCGLIPEDTTKELARDPDWVPPETGLDDRIRVASLNVHALPLSPSARRRMQSIGPWLESKADLPTSVVCVQEAFGSASSYLADHGLDGGVVFDYGSVGSGLMVWSSQPHESTRFVRFVENGSPLHVWRGDWYAGKGVAILTLNVGSGLRVSIANVHAIAKYTESDPYLEDRISQARQMRSVVDEELTASDVVALIGDYNFVEGGTEWRELRVSSDDLVVPTAPEAIDHIVLFCRSGIVAELQDHEYSTTLLEQDLTDHPAVVCTIRLRRSP